jgi:hypothetical protein
VDKENSPQERGMGGPSHSIVIDAADQPHIVYDEVVPRSIMKQEVLVHSHNQSPPAIHCSSIAEKMVNWQ